MAWVAVTVTVIVLTARWVARHPEQRPDVTRSLERVPARSATGRGKSWLADLGDRYGLGDLLWPALLMTLLAVLVVAGWAFGLLVQDVLNGDDAIDQPVVRYLAGHRAAWLTTAMHGATWLGSTVVLVPLVVVIGIAVRRRVRSWATGAQLVLALGGAITLNNLVKPLVGRPRPNVDPLVSTVSGFAFPSGHATQIAAVAVTVAILASTLTRSRSWRVAIWSAVVFTTLMVAFSRVYLGVHWPTDVLAGSVLGACWAVLTARALRWSDRRAGGEVAPGRRGHQWATSEKAG